MNTKYSFITIEGCIGSGKTSLAKKFSDDLNARIVLEQFENNPFLPKFYQHPEQYAFPLELFFMAERYQQIRNTGFSQDMFQNITVSDYLFTKSLIFASITLKEDEQQLFRRLFDIINSQLPVPQLIVYLFNSVPNLLYNISIRGRSYEQSIPAAYLEKLQAAYLQYFKAQKNSAVVIADVSAIDFVSNAEDYGKLKSLLDKDYEKGVHYVKVS